MSPIRSSRPLPSLNLFPAKRQPFAEENVQPDIGSHVSTVQGFPSSQVRAVPGWHTPA
jgi:hypothetical protein